MWIPFLVPWWWIIGAGSGHPDIQVDRYKDNSMSGAGHCGLTCTAWNAQQDQAGAATSQTMATSRQTRRRRAIQEMAQSAKSPMASANLATFLVLLHRGRHGKFCGLHTYTRGAVALKNLSKTSLNQRPRKFKKAVEQKLYHQFHQVRQNLQSS